MLSLFSEFESVAKCYSQEIALVCEGKSYTYSSLMNQAIEYAKLFPLHQKGLFILLPKSANLIAWQLAASYSKNVFCTVDTSNPSERVLHMLRQFKPQWVISEKKPDDSAYRPYLNLEYATLWENMSTSKDYSEHASHVFFSSGSTGLPKGVLLGIEGTLKVVKEQALQTKLQKGKKFAWFLSPGFDASMSDVYSTILSGAELHICRFQQNKIKTLQQYLKDHQITHTDLAPAVLPLLNFSKLTSLESIIFGGEVGSEKVIKELSKKISLFNAYGPTEASICTSFKKVDENWTASDIGQPWSFVKYKMSTENELLISGCVLAMGYLDDELNKKFVNFEGTRYYKTGDIVNFKSNSYHYKGRIDRQFKNNGVLISPEEIEAAALSIGCRIVKCDNVSGFVLYFNGEATEQDVRSKLQSILPSFMVPSKIIKTADLSTNINGKSQK